MPKKPWETDDEVYSAFGVGSDEPWNTDDEVYGEFGLDQLTKGAAKKAAPQLSPVSRAIQAVGRFGRRVASDFAEASRQTSADLKAQDAADAALLKRVAAPGYKPPASLSPQGHINPLQTAGRALRRGAEQAASAATMDPLLEYRRQGGYTSTGNPSVDKLVDNLGGALGFVTRLKMLTGQPAEAGAKALQVAGATIPKAATAGKVVTQVVPWAVRQGARAAAEVATDVATRKAVMDPRLAPSLPEAVREVLVAGAMGTAAPLARQALRGGMLAASQSANPILQRIGNTPLPPVVEAPIAGAAAGLAGTLASIPGTSAEDLKKLPQDARSLVTTMALMETMNALTNPVPADPAAQEALVRMRESYQRMRRIATGKLAPEDVVLDVGPQSSELGTREQVSKGQNGISLRAAVNDFKRAMADAFHYWKLTAPPRQVADGTVPPEPVAGEIPGPVAGSEIVPTGGPEVVSEEGFAHHTVTPAGEVAPPVPAPIEVPQPTATVVTPAGAIPITPHVPGTPLEAPTPRPAAQTPVPAKPEEEKKPEAPAAQTPVPEKKAEAPEIQPGDKVAWMDGSGQQQTGLVEYVESGGTASVLTGKASFAGGVPIRQAVMISSDKLTVHNEPGAPEVKAEAPKTEAPAAQAPPAQSKLAAGAEVYHDGDRFNVVEVSNDGRWVRIKSASPSSNFQTEVPIDEVGRDVRESKEILRQNKSGPFAPEGSGEDLVEKYITGLDPDYQDYARKYAEWLKGGRKGAMPERLGMPRKASKEIREGVGQAAIDMANSVLITGSSKGVAWPSDSPASADERPLLTDEVGPGAQPEAPKKPSPAPAAAGDLKPGEGVPGRTPISTLHLRSRLQPGDHVIVKGEDWTFQGWENGNRMTLENDTKIIRVEPNKVESAYRVDQPAVVVKGTGKHTPAPATTGEVGPGAQAEESPSAVDRESERDLRWSRKGVKTEGQLYKLIRRAAEKLGWDPDAVEGLVREHGMSHNTPEIGWTIDWDGETADVYMFSRDAEPKESPSAQGKTTNDGEVTPSAGSRTVRPEGPGAVEDVSSKDGSPAESAGAVAPGAESGGHPSGRPARKPSDQGSGSGQRGGDHQGDVDRPSSGGRSAEAASGQGSDATRTPATHGTGRNFRITESTVLAEGGKKTRFKNNVAAIKLMKQLQAEGRLATDEEKDVLAKFVGWGGIPEAFDFRYNFGEQVAANPEWKTEWQELRDLLTPEEMDDARRSVMNAHYTSLEVLQAMWGAALRLGFEGGRVLEPAAGIGHFLGTVPQEVARSASFTAVELDSVSAGILKLLYPESQTLNTGFEKADLPAGFYDLVIGNPPFGDVKILADPKRAKFGFQIHNYFFDRAMELVRPGGILMFVTGSGTMQAGHDAAVLRKRMAEEADLVAAIRLPGTAFKENAGTEVTTDILILRKKDPTAPPFEGEPWLNTGETEVEGSWRTFRINEYYQRHPENMLGKLADDKLHPGRLALVSDGRDLQKAATEIFAKLPRNIMSDAVPAQAEVDEGAMLPAPAGTIEGEHFVKDGKLYRVAHGKQFPIPVKTSREDKNPLALDAKAYERVRGMAELSAQLREVFRTQYDPAATEEALAPARKKLGQLYDAFVKKYGFLHDASNVRVFKADPHFALIMGLEKYTPAEGAKKDPDYKPSKAEKMPVFTRRTIFPYQPPTTAATAADALSIALNTKNRVDLEYMGSLTGQDPDKLARKLFHAGALYYDPRDGWTISAEFLSGNVKQRLRDVETALAMGGQPDDVREALEAGKKALEEVVPEDIPPEDIYVKLGVPWVSETDYARFLGYLTGRPSNSFGVRWDPVLNQWKVEESGGHWGGGSRSEWSTNSFDVVELARAAFTGHDPKVWEKDSSGARYLNVVETEAARAMVEKIEEEFSRWIWDDVERAGRLAHEYNENFNALVTRDWDGSYLDFPGMDPIVASKLRPYQKAGIARQLQNGSTLLGHAVGAGKTWEMAASLMKLRQLGICKKVLVVVPKHRVPGTAEDFQEAYPGMKILMTTPADFEKKSRNQLMARIATGDYDAIIVAHSQLKFLPMPEEFIRAQAEKDLAMLDEAIMLMESENGTTRSQRSQIKRLEKRREKRRQQMEEDIAEAQAILAAGGRTIVESGIDGLFLDESHEFKNLPFTANQQGVLGLGDQEGAQKASDLVMKLDYLRKLNGGRGILFATGTPISNSLTELYSLIRFLRPDVLESRNINNMDAFLKVFGEIRGVTELAPEGGRYRRVRRLMSYVNVPELMQLVNQFADIKTQKFLVENGFLKIPELETGKRIPIVTDATEAQQRIRQELMDRADALKGGGRGGIDGHDNVLRLMGFARMMSVDASLFDPTVPDEPSNKLNTAARKMHEIYKEFDDTKGVQIVFLDLGTPEGEAGKTQRSLFADAPAEDEAAVGDEEEGAPQNFELDEATGAAYGKLKRALIKLGVKPEEIAFMHDAKNDPKKISALQEKVRRGEVRFLLGSTKKMGTGLNVQDRLIALHHLDCPWHGADLQQREGRILRWGNMYPTVRIYSYVTKGTFDEGAWNKVAQKSEGVEVLLSGDPTIRRAQVGGEMTLGFADMAAAATEDPRVIELAELNGRILELSRRAAAFKSRQKKVKDDLRWGEAHLLGLKSDVEEVAKDVALKFTSRGDQFKITLDGHDYTDREEADKAALKLMNRDHVGEDVGKIGPFTLQVRDLGKGDFAWRATGPSGHEYYPNAVRMVSVEAALNPEGMERLLAKLKGGIETTTKDVEGYHRTLAQSFDGEEELKAARARKEEIEESMRQNDEAAMTQVRQATGEDAVDDEIESLNLDAEDNAELQRQSRAHSAVREGRQSGRPGWKPEGAIAERAGNPVAKMAVLNALRKAAAARIRAHRVRGLHRTARGQYDLRQKVIRVKDPWDFRVLGHEIGHRICDAYGLKPEKYADLEHLGEAIYKDKKGKHDFLRSEGAAEFFALWFSDPEKAKTEAPSFYADLEERLDNDPDGLGKRLREAQRLEQAWQKQNPVDKLVGMISSEADDQGDPDFLNVGEKLAVDWDDDLYAIAKATSVLTGVPLEKVEEALPEDANPYVLARLSRASSRAAYTLLNEKSVGPDLKVNGPSYREIWKPIAKQGERRIREFAAYRIAKRGLEESKNGKGSFGFTHAELEIAFRQLSCPEFRKADAQLRAFNDNLMEWLASSGALSSEGLALIKALHRHYVPLRRVFGKDERPRKYRTGRGGKMVNLGPVFKKYIGKSTRPIYDPVAAEVENVYRVMSIAYRARVGKALANLADKKEGFGWLIEKLPTPMAPQKVDLDRVKAAVLEAMGMTPEMMEEIDVDGMDLNEVATLFNPRRSANFADGQEAVITVRRGDRVDFYKLDPYLYDALLSMNEPGRNIFTDIAGVFVTMLRTGVVQDVAFAGANLLRDLGSRMMYTKGPISKIPEYFIRGIYASATHSDDYAEAAVAGALQAAPVQLNREKMEQHARWVLGQKSLLDRAYDMTFWWWEGLKAVTEFSDEANRQGEYQAVRDTGKGTKQAKLRAAYAAREGTIDFTRAGRLGRKANRVVAFFNPALQGGSKLYREAKKNPRRLIARGLIISMLSLLFWLLRYGDERKQELWHEEADYAKDLYWIYYTDDGHKVMIPKPFEPGIIFGSTVERALEIWQERDPEVARHFARSAIAAGLPNMLPQLMVVPGELWANKSFFTGRPIVPLGESRFEPGYQYGPRTTETAKAIGRRTGLSPYKVDHAVRGLFGGLGAGVMQLGDVAAGKAAEKRSPAESIPGVGRFYRSDLTGSQSVDKFYTELTALRKAKATADAGRKAADYDENRLIVLESAYDDISLYRSEQKDIMESDAWSPAEKRRSVADLDLQIVNAARAVYDKAPIEAPKKRK